MDFIAWIIITTILCVNQTHLNVNSLKLPNCTYDIDTLIPNFQVRRLKVMWFTSLMGKVRISNQIFFILTWEFTVLCCTASSYAAVRWIDKERGGGGWDRWFQRRQGTDFRKGNLRMVYMQLLGGVTEFQRARWQEYPGGALHCTSHIIGNCLLLRLVGGVCWRCVYLAIPTECFLCQGLVWLDMPLVGKGGEKHGHGSFKC